MRTTRGAATAAATLTLLLVAGCAAETEPAADTMTASEEPMDETSDDMSDDMSDEPEEDMAEDHEDDAMADDAADEDLAAVYDFTATTLDGEEFSGAELAGSPAVLWFWAPWCPTCRAQIPAVTALSETYGDDVSVVAVGGLDDAEAISAMAQSDIAGPTHLVDDAGEVWQHFGMTQQSTFVVLDDAGEVVLEGSVPADELDATVADLAG
ncbi:hypothetical protein GCM10023216_31380 [Isoptericola chiayiensis]|uniref:Thioredoxin domain-containing protein n=1 Tax=Isoptericola chiayiensis TaxID=579446 RepID=A0ABP8YPC1_9MICO|nr:redoxin family protein [Isoptericola chiayiensis]NOW01714.1 thiol-disulfide isomerase/thioredoxin [Isoptericola chiayiensis]